MGATKRIAKWDNVKFILILCVVIGHFLPRYDESLNAKRLIYFIYLFHMPAFIFISGLFAKSTINKKKYDKIFSFLVLFLVTKFSLFGINYLRGSSKKFELLEMNDVSWYAFAVFVFYLITIFFRRFSKVYVLAFSILVSCVVGFAKDVDTYLSLSRIFTYYPIFIIGYYLDINKVLEFSKKKIVIAASWAVIAVSGLIVYFKINEIYWFLTILKGKHGYSSMGKYAENGFVGRLLWYPLALIFTFAIIAIIPSVQCIFTTIGRRTMQIYALHYVPMLAFFGMFDGKNWAHSVWPEHEIILILGIAFLTTCLLGIKPIEIVMNKIIYPKLNSIDD